jgi:hypothetical protein
MKMKKKVTFTGKPDGDGECFCWLGVSKQEKIKIIGKRDYESDRRLTEDFLKSQCAEKGDDFCETMVERRLEDLHPGEIFAAMGLDKSKKYKFTITVQE